MKKSLLLGLLLGCFVVAQAQENPTSVTVVKKSDPAPLSYVTRVGHNYFMGNQMLPEEVFVNFLRANCPAAYAYRLRAERLYHTGWGLFGAGLGLDLIGGIMACVASFRYVDYPENPAYYDINQQALRLDNAGQIVASVGSALTIASIPCLIVGSVRMKRRTVEMYNAMYASPYRVQINIGVQSSANGIGLALQW